MKDLVSIVIPIYNMGSSIERTVNSLLLQDYNNIEIILVDDGSKDNSYTICQKLAEKDSRIKVFHIDNSGAGPARNLGIEHAHGVWIYFPDADDYIEPYAVSAMVNGTENGKFDLVVFGFIYMKNNRIITKKKFEDTKVLADDLRKDYSQCILSTSPLGIQGAPWNKLFKLETIKKYHIQYPPLRRHQDEAFIAYYMCHAQYVHFIPDILYTYYVNNLQKLWQKFPVDYYKAVVGLYESRKETILSWNKDDTITHECVDREYICKAIKSLELSFSPQLQLTKPERLEKMRLIISCTQLEQFNVPPMLGIYQRVILYLIKKQLMNTVYYIFRFKVFIESL